jgi:signal peptidase I
VPEPDETISFDTLSTHDLWWIRSLMIQEMPDSLIEFNIILSQDGQELKDYLFEDFRVPIENHKYFLINKIFSQNRIVPQSLKMGDTISGEISLNFFNKFARTGFLERYNPDIPQKSLFGSRLVGYDAFDGSHLEDLEANIAYANAKLLEKREEEKREREEREEEGEEETGDSVAPLVLKWQILVNGKPVNEYMIKDRVYFMMGDNRDNSADGRYWGFVSARNVKAKAFIIYFSLDRESKVELLKPWTWIHLPADIRWGRVARIIHLI